MTASLSPRDLRTRSGRTALGIRRAVGGEVRRLRMDAGLSLREVARAARINPGHLSAVERGTVEASLAVLVAIGQVLGADVSVRLFPGAGPRIRDRLQAPIVEAVLAATHPSWKQLVEVPVWRPARGVIDVVIARPAAIIVATEIHSELHRVEQQVRWATEKTASLPSAEAWSLLSGGVETTPTSRLLVLRNSRTNRDLARQFESSLRAAYPARAGDALRALREPMAPWPGAAILWADVIGGAARVLEGPPRNVGLGR